MTAICLLAVGVLGAAEPISYNRDVLPILAEHCFACHGFDKSSRQADLRLDRREDALRVLQRSPTQRSQLLERIHASQPHERMPPPETGKPLNQRQMAILEQWIKEDATYETHWAWTPPASAIPTPQPTLFSSQSAIDVYIQNAIHSQQAGLRGLSPRADRATRLRRVKLDLLGLPPTVEEHDNFLGDQRPDAYERLVDRWLASPRFGERWSRWWLDLAHYADSDGYLQDFLRPHAWRYRDWLIDALNSDKPFDEFTIEQLAGDLLAERLEKNSSAPLSEADRLRAQQMRIATGFLRNTLSNREGGADLEEYRVRQVVDRTNTVATAWLGLTIGCAECHDHKYDPITQLDFYQLYAYFNNVDEFNIDVGTMDAHEKAAIDDFYQWRTETLSPIRGEVDRLLAAWEAKLLWTESHPGEDHRWDRHLEVLGLIWGQGEGEGQLEGINIIKTPREQRTRDEQSRLEEYFFQRGSAIDPEKFKSLQLESVGSQINKRRTALPKAARAQTIASSRRHRHTHLHTRGDFRRPAQIVSPAIPSTFQKVTHQKDGHAIDDRVQLARWLVSDDQPLTARVTVNRLWQELFGRGLVATTENLGIRGSRPTHPQLLDWLAREFSQHDWSIKAILRQIVLSDTYQQASTVSASHRQLDPQNAMLSRQSRLRLNAESVRDLTLAASGLLERRIGGPSVRPPQPDNVAMEGFDNKWVADNGAERYRRGLYTFLQRTSPFAQSITFDLPETSRACTRRERSNTPLQALTLLNDPVLFEASVHAAQRLLDEARESGSTLRDQELVTKLTVQVLGRVPSPLELEKLVQHLQTQREQFRINPQAAQALLEPFKATAISRSAPEDVAAWALTCSVLLNLDEAITRN